MAVERRRRRRGELCRMSHTVTQSGNLSAGSERGSKRVLCRKPRETMERDRMCKEAAAERLNVVERVRLHSEAGAASEGNIKELAGKLANLASLCRRMRKRYRRARQRQTEGKLQEALTRQQKPEARRLAPQSGVQMPRNKTATLIEDALVVV